MKNSLIYLLPMTFLFSSCFQDEIGSAPSITIDSIYVDQVKYDFSQFDTISQSSVVEVFATLVDNDGGGLYTFNVEADYGQEVQSDNSYNFSDNSIQYSEVAIVDKVESDIQLNYGDTTLVFKDNVRETKVTIQSNVFTTVNEEMEFKLLLNLNTKDVGSVERISFKVVKE